MPNVLTIDLGTSGPKAAVVDDAAHVLGAARASVPTLLGEDRSAEQDPDAVWHATSDSIRGALAAAGVSAASIVAIAVSSQYSSIVPIGADGAALGNMMLWMDQRGSPKRLRALDGYPRSADSPLQLLHWLRVHGLAPVDGSMSLNHMRWIKYAEPDRYAQTVCFLEPVDFLTMRFTGRATANRCSAHMMMLTDNRGSGASAWDPDLVRRSLIDADKLPEFVEVGSQIGGVLPEVAESLGLRPGTPVLAGINDTQAGAVAAGACFGDHAGIAIGTSSVITTGIAKKKTNPFKSLFTIPSPFGSDHLVSGENGVAGVAVDHFLDELCFADDAFAGPAASDIDRYEAFNLAVRSSSPTQSRVLFLPWLQGSIAPAADGGMRGGFLNVGLNTTRADLARAVLEGVALNLRWLLGPVEKFVGRKIPHFAFYGGGARSPEWPQIMADALGAPVHRMEAPGFANCVGAALFAFDRLGVADAREVVDRVGYECVVEPNPASADRYDELAAALVEAHKRTKPIVHRINRRS